MYIRNN